MQTFAVYVDNKPGVLNRVASLFRRRAFNIESLTVGHTEMPGLSRMTIVVDTDERGARLVEANLYKLIPVRRVDNITQLSTIARDLAMIKVSATGDAPDARDAARRRLPRADRRRQPRLARDRDHRHRGQDRQPARGAPSVRRRRNGPDRPGRDGPRRRRPRREWSRRREPRTWSDWTTPAADRCRSHRDSGPTRDSGSGLGPATTISQTRAPAAMRAPRNGFLSEATHRRKFARGWGRQSAAMPRDKFHDVANRRAAPVKSENPWQRCTTTKTPTSA